MYKVENLQYISSEKHVVTHSVAQETVPVIVASFYAPRQRGSQGLNTDALNAQSGKKVRQSKLSSAQTPAQSYQTWHPDTTSKMPNLSLSQSSGFGGHDIVQLKGKETSETKSVPVHVPKRKNAAVEPIPPYNYFGH